MNSAAVNEALSSKARSALRARAHGLKPVVWVAESGISAGAMHEIDRALTAHELIKIHAGVAGREARSALLDQICATLGAQPVQIIGKMLVAFRPRPDEAAAVKQESARAPKRVRRTHKADRRPVRR